MKSTALCEHCEGKCIVEIDLKKVDTELVIFISITDISFLLLKHFVSLTIFGEKNGSVLRCSPQWLNLSKFYQLNELISCRYFIGLWETSKETSCMKFFSTEAAVLKPIPSIFFLEICKSFRATSKKLVLVNYVLVYHTTDKDHAHAEIL